jgi:hypothetical protein
LYLAFPAGPWGAEGFLVARVSVESPDGRPPRLALTQARLAEREGNPFLDIEGSGAGTLRVTYLYSRAPRLAKAWFTCPEAGDLEPYELTFLPAYEFGGLDASTGRMPIAAAARAHSFPIPPEVTKGIPRLDRAIRVQEALSKGLATEDGPYTFDRQKLTVQALRELASAAAGANATVHVAVKPDRGDEILAGEAHFDPTLRQKIALRDPDGGLTGAELWIAMD